MFNLKSQKRKGPSDSKKGAADLRIQKDITDLSLPSTCKMNFPKTDDLLNFELTIQPDEGMYTAGIFKFTFKIPPSYPHEAPKVKCVTKVFHPNIDLEGNVCLNILREDWKPVLTINAVVYGLQYLFLEPNPDDPLNKEAAEVLKTNHKQFELIVRRTMRGGSHGATMFDCCI